jgi:predicted nucleotidyltransferase
MKYRPPSKQRGLAIARKMKERLVADGIPVVDVYLFGSLVNGRTHKWSDVDIAVVHKAFADGRMQERRRVRSLREDFDVPMDIVCLRPEDFDNRYWALPQEVKKHGIPV